MSIVRTFADAFNRGDVDGLLDCFTEDATSGASSTRSVSYARKSSDFNALSEHRKIFEISE